MQISSVKVRNLLSGKYFHKILYHQTTKSQAKIDELKTICLLGCFFCLFVCFFEEIEFTANANILMQVSPSMAVMQKIHASCMDGRFLVPPFDMSSQHKCQQQF